MEGLLTSSSPMSKVKRRRKMPVAPKECPNPLFERWLTEWRDEAASKNLKTKYVYDKALRSLRKYPLRLASGREAIILDFFGKKICDMLDGKLANHSGASSSTGTCRSTTDSNAIMPMAAIATSVPAASTATAKASSKRTNVAAITTIAYVPIPKTGPYALLMALHNVEEFISKTALVAAAQPMCDKSFTVPDHGSYYTAWSSMSTLVKKGLVCKEGNPARYILTDTGHDLVTKLLSSERDSGESQRSFAPLIRAKPTTQPRFDTTDEDDDDDENDDVDDHAVIVSNLPKPLRQFQPPPLPSSLMDEDASNSCSSTVPEFHLAPGEFDVILCVDNCETVSGGFNERKLMVQSELRKNGVNFDVRKLHVGDFLWVAKERVSIVPGRLQPPKSRELVLNYIVERKRKDDLAASIIDGRFHEQKYRLRNCKLKNAIYLVEEYGAKNHLPLPESSLQQAIVNTQVGDGFVIKCTKDVAESVAYLTLMTRHIQSVHSNKTLYSCSGDQPPGDGDGRQLYLTTFDDFNRSSMKVRPPSVTELFVRQLIQVSGISTDRAAAIVRLYPTPAALFARYARCGTQADREALLASVQYGFAKRNLGLAASKQLCQLYNAQQLR